MEIHLQKVTLGFIFVFTILTTSPIIDLILFFFVSPKELVLICSALLVLKKKKKIFGLQCGTGARFDFFLGHLVKIKKNKKGKEKNKKA